METWLPFSLLVVHSNWPSLPGSFLPAEDSRCANCTKLQALLAELAVRERTLVLLDAATGLRVGELLALRWDNVDFANLEIRVTEPIWHQVLGVCKTEAPARPVPMDGCMAEDLLRWRKTCAHPLDSDWVFASPNMKGKQP